MAFPKLWKNRSGGRTYFAWRSMNARCYNTKHDAYLRYGGRGIKVCARWRSNYDAFFADMGEVPAGLSLDRINNNKGYSKKNCRWATMKEQQNNRSSNRHITHKGVTRNLTQWAVQLGIGTDTLCRRLNVLKMPLNKALTAGSLNPVWRHGTRQGYEAHKCKCDLCRESNNTRHRERRAKQKLIERIQK